MKVAFLLASLFATATHAARLSLNGGVLSPAIPRCGIDCLQDLDCSAASVSSFSSCIELKCSADDTTVASAVERFMSSCHNLPGQMLDSEGLQRIKNLYVSSQMAIIKRQAAAMANSTSSSNSTNATNSTTSGTTSGSTTSSTQTGTHASGCASIGEVLDGSCIVRSSGAGNTVRNSALSILGGVALVAYIL